MPLVVKNPSANAGDIRDTGLIPRSGRSPGGGHGNPFHHSCLENPMGKLFIRVSYIWNIDNTKYWQPCRATGMHIHHWWNSRASFEDTLVVFLQNLTYPYPMIQPSHSLEFYLKKLKTCAHKTCILIIMADLFIIAKNCKQLWCPSVGEWVNKL